MGCIRDGGGKRGRRSGSKIRESRVGIDFVDGRANKEEFRETALSDRSVRDIKIIHLAICEIDALVHVNGIEIPWLSVDDVEHLLLGDVKERFEEDLILVSDLQ